MSLPAGMNHWRIKASLATTCVRQNPKGYLLKVKNKHIIWARDPSDLSPRKYHHLILSFIAILAE